MPPLLPPDEGSRVVRIVTPAMAGGLVLPAATITVWRDNIGSYRAGETPGMAACMRPAGKVNAMNARWAVRRGLLKPMVVILTCVVLLCSVERRGPFAMEDANWESILKKYQESYRLALDHLKKYSEKLKTQSKDFRRGLVKLEKKRGQIFLWFGGTYDPEDLKYILLGTANLRSEAARLIAPIDSVKQDLDLFGDKMDEVQMEILGQLTYVPRVEYGEALKSFLRDISDLRIRLSKVNGSIENAKNLHTGFLDRLGEMERAALTKIPRYEGIFYFDAAPHLFSGKAWESMGEEVEEFLSLWNILKESLRDSEEEETIELACFQSLLITGGLIFLAWLGIRKVVPKFGDLPELRLLFRPAVLFSVSAGLYWTAGKIIFILYPALSSLGDIVLGAGLVSLARSLRLLTRGPGPFAGKKHPLWMLWTLATVGVVLRVLSLPYGFELILWIMLLLMGSLRFHIESRKAESRWDLVFMRLLTVICVVLAFCATCGFTNVSLLAVFVLFYATVTFRLGQFVVHLLKSLEVKVREGVLSPTLAAFIQGFGFPAVILGFVMLNLWFLASHVGGDEVFARIFSFQLTGLHFRVSLKIVFLIVTGFYLTRAAILISDSLVLKFRQRRPDVDLSVMDSFLKGTKYLWWSVFALATLALLGFSLTSITVIAGGLSVGIGFGLQHIVNNLFSGLILLFGRAIQPGDTIQIGNTMGDVRRVTIRSTVVQTRENATLFIPNSDLMTNQIVNWSHRDREVVREITVGVAYGSDTAKVKDLLLRAALVQSQVRKDPPPQVLFFGFGASSLDFKVKFRVENVDDDQPVMSDVCFEIDRLFRENGIEIAFPQTDFHLRTATGLEALLGRRSGRVDRGS